MFSVWSLWVVRKIWTFRGESPGLSRVLIVFIGPIKAFGKAFYAAFHRAVGGSQW
jgi:hypothetical protein